MSDADAVANGTALVPGVAAAGFVGRDNVGAHVPPTSDEDLANHARARVYCAGSAYGSIAPPVTVVQDKKCVRPVAVMSAQAPGIACASGSATQGMLIEAKSRGSSAVGHLAMMHVLRSMVAHRQASEELHGRHMALFVDGASDQTKDAVQYLDGKSQESEVLQFCEEHQIVLVKLPGSSTSISQPLDVGSCFRSAKTALRMSMKDVSDETVRDTHTWQVDALTQWLSNEKETPAKSHKDMAGFLCRVSDALEKGLLPAHVRNSFAHAGYYPYNAQTRLGAYATGAAGLGFSGTRRMRPLVAAAHEIHRLALKYQEQGYLLEVQYEEAGFRTSPEEVARLAKGRKARDFRCVQQQRAVIFTSKEFAKARMRVVREEAEAAASKKLAAARSKRIAKQEKERARQEAVAWQQLVVQVHEGDTPNVAASKLACYFCRIAMDWTREHEVLGRLHTAWTGPLCKTCSGMRVCPRQVCQSHLRGRDFGAHRVRCLARQQASVARERRARTADQSGAQTPPKKRRRQAETV